MRFSRYALYYVPPGTADWARYCYRWLGWDAETGRRLSYPKLAGLPKPVAELSVLPGRYGLHATLKPPFRLAAGATVDDLEAGCDALAARLTPVRLDGLALTRMGRFLTLCPVGDQQPLNDLASACVRELDRFRAPLSVAEQDRRRAGGLTPAQTANLTRWGYPFVMDAFRFHITLTGRLEPDELAAVETALSAALAPLLPGALWISDLALVGEAADGRFRLLRRFALAA